MTVYLSKGLRPNVRTVLVYNASCACVRDLILDVMDWLGTWEKIKRPVLRTCVCDTLSRLTVSDSGLER